ncbi:hypothetical protein J1N35_038728, partial [Gossypium stocksii]
MDGDAVTSTSSIADPAVLYYHFLGRSLGDGTSKFTSLKFPQLRENFETLPGYAAEMEKIHAARAYILRLIG